MNRKNKKKLEWEYELKENFEEQMITFKLTVESKSHVVETYDSEWGKKQPLPNGNKVCIIVKK